MNHFIETLSFEDKVKFRKTLLNLKHSQEEKLFTLEQEYLNLVRERRAVLINFLKNPFETSKKISKSTVNDQLKEMHSKTQHDLAAFLKSRVFQGWQLKSLSLQIDELKRSGVPKVLFLLQGRERDGMGGSEEENSYKISYYREMMKYLLFTLEN